MSFKTLFGKMDDGGVFSFMPVWFAFFLTSFGVMLGDSSVGAPRNFCAVSQIICCTNLCAMAYSITNNVPLSKANLLTAHITFTKMHIFRTKEVHSHIQTRYNCSHFSCDVLCTQYVTILFHFCQCQKQRGQKQQIVANSNKIINRNYGQWAYPPE